MSYRKPDLHYRNFYSVFIFLFVFGFQTTVFGQQYILDKKDTAEVRFINKKKFYLYKVEKGETIYSITKKFNVTPEELTEFNPDLKDGLKNKMKLWIPANNLSKVTEQKKEEPKTKKAVLHFSLLLPFNIDHHHVSNELLNDSMVLDETMSKETISSLEFYEGLLYALDTLTKIKDQKVELHVYDTRDDSLTALKILGKTEMLSSNVIYAWGANAVIRQTNSFSIKNKVPFFSSTLNTADLVKDNPYAVCMLPSSLTQCKQIGKYAGQLYPNSQAFIIKTAITKENDRSKAFKAGWKEMDKNAVVKELTFSKSYLTVLEDSLSSVKQNVLFIPSSNEDFVSSLLNALNELSDKKKITVIGIPTWQYFETIDPALFEKLNTYLFSTSAINYDDEITLRFRSFFRDRYNTEPSDLAYQGYDLMNLISTNWKKDGKNFAENILREDFNGLFTTYHFEATDTFTENDHIILQQYKDYSLQKVNSPGK